MLQKKICILGPTGVGKTSLIKKYVEGIFSDKYLTSIGVKIDKKIVMNTYTPVQMMIWDLEGIDKYCGFNPRFLRGVSGLILVADQTRFSSLADTMEILGLAKNECQVPTILAVNKVDLNASINWDDSILKSHCTSFNDVFFTSAKSGQGVEKMFETLAKLVTS